MSSSASASAYWRVAGMSYLKYSGLCADMVRAALKEPAKTKARTREVVFFRRADWKDGQPQKQSKLSCSREACSLSLADSRKQDQDFTGSCYSLH